MRAIPRRTSHASRCFSYAVASGHDAKIAVSTVTLAHDIGRCRSERLRSLWFNKPKLIVFVGVADCGLLHYPLTAASSSLHNFLRAIPEIEHDHVEKPESARRCSVGFNHFAFLFRCGLFHFLYTRRRTRVIVAVSAEPTEVMRECLFVLNGIIEEIFLCGSASPTSVIAWHEEVLEGAFFAEAARIVQGGCTLGLDFVNQLTVSDYLIWFANVLC